MARTSTYLNFSRRTEEAFEYYKSVFRTDYLAPVARFDSAPPHPDHPLAEGDRDLILHVELPILGGHVLMGTDCSESMGFILVQGNNVHLNLEPDNRAEADRLFAALSDDGTVGMPMMEMFWGGYFGSFTDRFGIHWMINCANPA